MAHVWCPHVAVAVGEGVGQSGEEVSRKVDPASRASQAPGLRRRVRQVKKVHERKNYGGIHVISIRPNTRPCAARSSQQPKVRRHRRTCAPGADIGEGWGHGGTAKAGYHQAYLDGYRTGILVLD